MASLQLLLGHWRNEIRPFNITCHLTDSDHLYVGLDSGTILRYSLNDYRLEMAMIGHGGPVKALCLSRYKMDLPKEPVTCLVSVDLNGELSVWSASDGRCLLHNGRAVEGEVITMLPFGSEMIVVATRSHGLQIIRVATLEPVQRLYFDEQSLPDHNASARSILEIEQVALWEEDLLIIRMESGHLYSLKGAMGRIVSRPELIAEQVAYCDANGAGILMLIRKDGVEMRGPLGHETIAGHWRDGLILSEGVYLLRDQQGIVYNTGTALNEGSLISGSLIRISWRAGLVLSSDGLLSNGHDLAQITKCAGSTPTAAIFYHPDHREHSQQCSDELIVGYADGSCQVMGIAALLHPITPRLTLKSPLIGSDPILNLMTTSDERWGELLVGTTAQGKLLVWSLEGREQPLAKNEAEEEMLRLHVKPFYHSCPVERSDPLIVLLAHPQAPPHSLLEGPDGHVYSVGEDGHVVRLEMFPRMQIRHFYGTAKGSPIIRLAWSTTSLYISYACGNTCEWDLTKWTLRPKMAQSPPNGLQYRLINAPGHGHWEPHNVMAWGGTLRLCRYHRNEPWCLNVLLDLRAMVEMHGQLKIMNCDESCHLSNDDEHMHGDALTNAQAFKDFCRQLIGVIVDWDVPELSARYPALGLIRPHDHLSIGSLGANRNGAVKCAKHRWAISHTLTASLHLALEILLRMRPSGEDWHLIRHWYACQLPLGWKMKLQRQARRSDPFVRVRSNSIKRSSSLMADSSSPVSRHYCHDDEEEEDGLFSVQEGCEDYLLPSLSVAAKYWHDQLDEIKRASRSVIQMTLDHFHPHDLHELVDFWSHSLPTAVKHSTGDPMPMNRSAIILAIIAIHHPSYLTAALQKAVAESLMTLLADERRNLFRPAAIELLGLGASLWESHLSLVAIERLLCSWMAGQLAKLEENGATNGRINEQLMAISEESVCRLLAHAPMTLIPCWLADIGRPGRAYPERLLFLRILDRMSTGYPLALRPFCPAIGDALIRLLDPNIPNIRIRLLPHFAAMLPRLLSSSPWWAWHGPTQRLACGSPDGPIVVLDVRTGSRFQVLEGMTHAITSVAFHPDGRFVVAYSAAEACIRWWILATGLLGLLHVAGKPTRSFVVDPPLTEAVLANELAPVRFTWLNSQTVQITVDGEPITVIPSLA